MDLSESDLAALRELLAAPGTPVGLAARARIVLLRATGGTRGEVAAQCGVSLPTVDRWVSRFAEQGVAGLVGRSNARRQVPGWVRRRVLELAASPPPADVGLERWTTRTLAAYLAQGEGALVSNNYIALVLREAGVRLAAPPRSPIRRERPSAPLDVYVEFVVVDGPPARALRERQTEAIAAVLQWFRDHPQES
ncbi:helix-turn-helix domain-containing protein [Actinocrinis puniceicyclus]|uniref:Helix-turn-helix domain-containing protein n=1 Tax=Actinocrinis puniceicyclus TaxID=977794 RepID=A0A8J7WSA8_9ACTN|nr:helix-turn-helix domain-containing protein [Actinocrinis puniceicyclus]MBS2965825.1 helix-turn-helix domain-containing protein [Actinocrinis puniceicyclus]